MQLIMKFISHQFLLNNIMNDLLNLLIIIFNMFVN